MTTPIIPQKTHCYTCESRLTRKNPPLACGKCHQVWYCSLACQKEDWTPGKRSLKHRDICPLLGYPLPNRVLPFGLEENTLEGFFSQKAGSFKAPFFFGAPLEDLHGISPDRVHCNFLIPPAQVSVREKPDETWGLFADENMPVGRIVAYEGDSMGSGMSPFVKNGFPNVSPLMLPGDRCALLAIRPIGEGEEIYGFLGKSLDCPYPRDEKNARDLEEYCRTQFAEDKKTTPSLPTVRYITTSPAVFLGLYAKGLLDREAIPPEYHDVATILDTIEDKILIEETLDQLTLPSFLEAIRQYPKLKDEVPSSEERLQHCLSFVKIKDQLTEELMPDVIRNREFRKDVRELPPLLQKLLFEKVAKLPLSKKTLCFMAATCPGNPVDEKAFKAPDEYKNLWFLVISTEKGLRSLESSSSQESETAAYQAFSTAAHLMRPEGQFLLGSFFRTSQTRKYLESACFWLSEIADKDDYVKYELALCKFAQHQQKEAISWLERIAVGAQPIKDVNFRLYSFYKSNRNPSKDEQTLKLFRLKKGAEQGELPAMYTLARCYREGQDMELDLPRAFYWFRKAAQAGYGDAMHALSQCYEKGLGTQKNLEKAFFWAKRNASVPHIYKNENEIEVARFYLHGIGTKQDTSRGMQILKKHFRDPNPSTVAKAKRVLAHFSSDPKLKAASLRQAAELGDPEAKYELALQNETVSEWSASYAPFGGLNAIMGMGNHHLRKGEVDKAFEWFQKAADLGDPKGLEMLGLLYMQRGQPDAQKAFDSYRKAVKAGSVSALLPLALCYRDGKGTSPNPKEAFRLLRRALQSSLSDLDKAEVCVQLAQCYERGLGTHQNLETARETYRKAIDLDPQRSSLQATKIDLLPPFFPDPQEPLSLPEQNAPPIPPVGPSTSPISPPPMLLPPPSPRAKPEAPFSFPQGVTPPPRPLPASPPIGSAPDTPLLADPSGAERVIDMDRVRRERTDREQAEFLSQLPASKPDEKGL